MRMQRSFTVPKADDLPNEDCYWPDRDADAFALSDGASISYNSSLWAHIICRRYAQSPVVTREWLEGCVAEYNAHHDREGMPWYKQNAFDRGSFASLLGVRRLANGALHIDAVGDSIAVLCDG